MVKLKRTTNTDSDFLSLVSGLDTELSGNYGDAQKLYNKQNITNNEDRVLVAYDEEKPVGCGSFRIVAMDKVEIKRMFVEKTSRGKGISRLILTELESWAKQQGFVTAILETGTLQHEAIKLYSSSAYIQIPNYGVYEGMKTSICFEKTL